MNAHEASPGDLMILTFEASEIVSHVQEIGEKIQLTGFEVDPDDPVVDGQRPVAVEVRDQFITEGDRVLLDGDVVSSGLVSQVDPLIVELDMGRGIRRPDQEDILELYPR